MSKFMSSKWIIFFIFFFGFFGVLFTHAETYTNGGIVQATCGNVEVLPTPSLGTYDDNIDVYINISNNSCEMSALGFDFFYDTNMFSYQGISTLNCLTDNWSMLDAYEVSPGQVRIGGYAGSGSYIQPTDNGSLVIVTLRVICQCGVCVDGQQSTLTIDDYNDDLAMYLPHPATGIFTMICCSGDIALSANEAGTWGDIVYIPVGISNNSNQISDFEFDFVFNSAVFDFVDAIRTSATQEWTTMSWNLVSAGQVRITGIVGSGTSIPSSSTANIVNMKLMVKCVTYSQDTLIPIQIERYRDGIVDMCPRTYETDFLYRTCPRLGDVNSSDSVTPGDAQAAFEIYLGRTLPTTAQLTVADANCSCPCADKEHTEEENCITPGDSQWIFEHYLGIRVLPLCCADFTCGSASPLNGDDSLLFPFEDNGPDFEKRIVYPLPTIARSTENVMIPVMIDNPEGLRHFGLELSYPQDLLEYAGTLAAPLTQGIMQVRGELLIPGVVRIEGNGDTAITTREAGSLNVVVFKVKEGVAGSAHIVLGSFVGDICDAKAGSSTFLCGDDLTGNERSLTLRHGKRSGRLHIIPVEVTDAFDMKAFGLEVKYSADKMTFLGVEPTELTRDFVAVDGNEVSSGVVRIGGYSMSGIQDMKSGGLVELVFQVSESGGQVEITRILDDLQDYLIVK
ncbi:MAG: cohesin domain-containing protein [Candidatus Aminicenantes bacterium]